MFIHLIFQEYYLYHIILGLIFFNFISFYHYLNCKVHLEIVTYIFILYSLYIIIYHFLAHFFILWLIK